MRCSFGARLGLLVFWVGLSPMDSQGAKRTPGDGVPIPPNSAKVFIRSEIALDFLCKVLHRYSLPVKYSF